MKWKEHDRQCRNGRSITHGIVCCVSLCMCVRAWHVSVTGVCVECFRHLCKSVLRNLQHFKPAFSLISRVFVV